MLLFWALPTSNSRADQHRATELAKVRQDVRAEVGVVVARGPYAGAYADVSYREATVRYRGWNGENVELHRMVGALDSRAEFGRSVQVHVTRVGPDYLPIESEYSRPAADPYNPKIDAGQGGRWVGCIFLALVMIVGGTSLSYGAWLLWKLPSVTETPIAT
jgi:hypothetical protein